MANEDKQVAQVATNSPDVSQENSQESQYSSVEKEAMSQGWVPEDQYSGPGKWRTADDFLDRGEFFKKLHEKDRKLQALESSVADIKRHYQQNIDANYKRVLAQLRAEKANALDEGNHSKVVDLDERILETKDEAKRALHEAQHPQVEAQQLNPVLVAWTNRNPWYESNTAMKAFSDEIGNKMMLAGERNPEKILEEVERRVKKEFPEKFSNPNRDKPNNVEAGSAKTRKSNDGFTLSDQEEQVLKKFLKVGLMTREEYIKDLKEQRSN